MDEHVQAISKETLAPLVRKAMANAPAQITSWQVEEMRGGWGSAVGGTALYRIAGETERHGAWSIVLKILYERPGEAQDSPYYWKREFEIYRSGILNQLPEIGLMPPQVHGFDEFPGSCWIWMADIEGKKQNWSLEDFGAVSRLLGRFNGAYLSGVPIPNEPWLNDNWHCRIIPPLADAFEKLDAYLGHPLIQRALPLAEKENILAIWHKAHRFCDGLASLPQTLCHIDAFPGNLLHSGKDIILIDWALAGRGFLGEDLTALVALPLYGLIPMSQAEALDEAVFAGYVAGLHDMGWNGDSQLVRLGYTCAMTLRGLAGVKQDIGVLVGESEYPKLHQDPEAIADKYAAVRRFRLLKMADKAQQLLPLFGK